MNYEISDILTGAALFQMAFFSFFLLMKKTENPVPNRILAAFLFSNVLVLTNLLVFRFLPDSPRMHHLYYLGFSFSVLWGPLLYLYTRSITRARFRLRMMEFLHGLPLLACLVFLAVRYRYYFIASGRISDQEHAALTWSEHEIIIGSIQLLILVYTLLAFRDLLKYRKEIRNSISSVERHNLSWLGAVLFGFLAHWAFDTVFYVHFYLTRRPSMVLLDVSFAVLLVFAQILVYKSMHQSEILFGIESKPKYRDSTLTEAQKKQYLKQLETVMTGQRPYLDPMLTLPSLARKAHIPPRHLSQILNEDLKQNFFDYINSRRIEDSKRLLRENARQEKTVLEILLEVGFNSKSSFNSAFKRYTGMTPTSFIRSA
jgi:AraC-like DNA-binding protein